MAGSINKVTLIGNLGNDPETRVSQDNKKIVRLSLATSDNWKDKSTGERREKTEWHRIVIFSNGLADIAEKYLKKGSKVYVEGQLQTRKYTDQAGMEKYTTEVVLQNFNSTLVMLDGRSENVNFENSNNTSNFERNSSSNNFDDSNSTTSFENTKKSIQPEKTQSSEIDINDDIPF